MLTNIFTDGSSLNNKDAKTRKAGSGVLITIDKQPIVSIGHYLNNSTNNYAELYAATSAIIWVSKYEKYKPDIPKKIKFYSDSKYVLGIVTNETKNIKENKKIIFALKNMLIKIRELGFDIEFEHIKAHTNKKDFYSTCNSIVDKIAKKCAKEEKNHYERYDKEDKPKH